MGVKQLGNVAGVRGLSDKGGEAQGVSVNIRRTVHAAAGVQAGAGDVRRERSYLGDGFCSESHRICYQEGAREDGRKTISFRPSPWAGEGIDEVEIMATAFW